MIFIDSRFLFNFIRKNAILYKKHTKGFFHKKQQMSINLVSLKNEKAMRLDTNIFFKYSLFLNSIFAIRSAHYYIFNYLKSNFFFSFNKSNEYARAFSFSLLDFYFTSKQFFYLFNLKTFYLTFFNSFAFNFHPIQDFYLNNFFLKKLSSKKLSSSLSRDLLYASFLVDSNSRKIYLKNYWLLFFFQNWNN
jgi:hypothetical protein